MSIVHLHPGESYSRTVLLKLWTFVLESFCGCRTAWTKSDCFRQQTIWSVMASLNILYSTRGIFTGPLIETSTMQKYQKYLVLLEVRIRHWSVFRKAAHQHILTTVRWLLLPVQHVQCVLQESNVAMLHDGSNVFQLILCGFEARSLKRFHTWSLSALQMNSEQLDSIFCAYVNTKCSSFASAFAIEFQHYRLAIDTSPSSESVPTPTTPRLLWWQGMRPA